MGFKKKFMNKIMDKFSKKDPQDNSYMNIVNEMFLYNLMDSKNSQEVSFGSLIKDSKPIKTLTKNMRNGSSAIFVGQMGSGKSIALNSAVLSFIYTYSENHLIFIIDPLSGAGDHSQLFGLPKVFAPITNDNKILDVISLAYNEMMARKDKLGSDKLSAYEEKVGKKIDRLLLCFESFHYIPSLLKFEENHQIEGTPAYMFYQIMKIGRFYGVGIFAASQVATKEYLPEEILRFFSEKFVFKTTNGQSKYVLGYLDDSTILTNQKGLCLSPYGMIQFPYFNQDQNKDILKGFNKNSDFKCETITHNTKTIFSLV